MLLRTKGAHVGHREAAIGAGVQASVWMRTCHWLRLESPWKGSSWTQNPGLHCMWVITGTVDKYICSERDITILRQLIKYQGSCSDTKVLCSAMCSNDGEMCGVGGFYSAESLAQSDKENQKCPYTSHSCIPFGDSHLQWSPLNMPIRCGEWIHHVLRIHLYSVEGGANGHWLVSSERASEFVMAKSSKGNPSFH